MPALDVAAIIDSAKYFGTMIGAMDNGKIKNEMMDKLHMEESEDVTVMTMDFITGINDM